MIVFFCLLAFGEVKIDSIDLKQYGFTDFNFIRFHKVDDRVLVIGTQDNRVAIIEPKGKLVAQLDRSGKGLANPMLLGVTQTEILLVFNAEKVMAFDHELKPSSSQYPPLTKRMMMGSALGKNQFLLFTFGNESHALTHLALEDKAWQVKRELIPMEYQEGQSHLPKFRATVHHGLAFVWQPLLMGQDSYSIDVFETIGKEKEDQVLALQNNIENIADFKDNWPILVSASRFGEKFAVMVLFAHPETYAYASQWVDIFTNQGDFLQRREVKKMMALKPLAGSNQLLSLNTETMVLKTFQ